MKKTATILLAMSLLLGAAEAGPESEQIQSISPVVVFLNMSALLGKVEQRKWLEYKDFGVMCAEKERYFRDRFDTNYHNEAEYKCWQKVRLEKKSIIGKKLIKAVREVAQRRGAGAVIKHQSIDGEDSLESLECVSKPVWLVDERLDITQDVLDSLNFDYLEKKGTCTACGSKVS